MIRRTLPSYTPKTLKKQLYISLVRSHLSYSSQLCRPRLIKNILSIERLQRKATKFILNDYTSDYRTRLIIHVVPLMHWFELQDIMFLVKCLQNPADGMNINTYITFVNISSITRAGSRGNKLRYKDKLRTRDGRHFYFISFVRLWNSLPSIDITKSSGVL